MSKLVWGVTRVLPFKQEQAALGRDLPMMLFVEAYRALRAACPQGDLRIHLSVEGSAEDVGVRPDAEWQAQS